MAIDTIQRTIRRNLRNFNWTAIKPFGLSFHIECEYLNESLLFTIQIKTLVYIGELEIYLETLFEECDELKEWRYTINTEDFQNAKNGVNDVLLSCQKKMENLDEIKDEMFKTERMFREEPIHTILESIGIETSGSRR